MKVYYNDNDLCCCQWLRNLIAAGLIPQGDVDERSIADVQPGDVAGYTHCHFFAGIGGWSLALRLAGWPDDRPIWSGSCPCQPFSVAGRRKGIEDPRHLWPDFHRLIRASRPAVVMGEQVAGAAGYAWLCGVGSDLEAEGYAWRAVDIPACSVGAPHIRSRLYWVAHSQEQPEREPQHQVRAEPRRDSRPDTGRSGARLDWLADCLGPRLEGRAGERRADGALCEAVERSGDSFGGLGNASGNYEWRLPLSGTHRQGESFGGPSGGFWDSWVLVGPDPQGKFRRVKPRVCLLAHGVPARVAKLRALGNAICPELAAEVVRAWMESKS